MPNQSKCQKYVPTNAVLVCVAATLNTNVSTYFGTSTVSLLTVPTRLIVMSFRNAREGLGCSHAGLGIGNANGIATHHTHHRIASRVCAVFLTTFIFIVKLVVKCKLFVFSYMDFKKFGSPWICTHDLLLEKSKVKSLGHHGSCRKHTRHLFFSVTNNNFRICAGAE